jgi:enoyl-CoA hydratase
MVSRTGFTVTRQDTYWHIAWSYPERANALGTLEWEELRHLIQAVPRGAAIVLEGMGRWFSAGFDRREWERLDRHGRETAIEAVNGAMAALRQHEGLTLARVNGAVAGGALALLVEADWRLAERPVPVSCPMDSMGVRPSPRFVAQLAQALGAAAVTRLLVGGERLVVAPDAPLFHGRDMPTRPAGRMAISLRRTWPEDGRLTLWED